MARRCEWSWRWLNGVCRKVELGLHLLESIRKLKGEMDGCKIG